jgi:hypothetical protein
MAIDGHIKKEHSIAVKHSNCKLSQNLSVLICNRHSSNQHRRVELERGQRGRREGFAYNMCSVPVLPHPLPLLTSYNEVSGLEWPQRRWAFPPSPPHSTLSQSLVATCHK